MGFAILKLTSFLLEVYLLAMIVYVVMSWIPNLTEHPLYNFLSKWIEPYFAIFRRYIPLYRGLDLSILVAIIIYQVIVVKVVYFVVWFLFGYI